MIKPLPNINKPNVGLDPLIIAIVKDLENGMPKKEAANKHNMELGNVIKIYNRFNIGSKKKEEKEMEDTNEFDKTEEIKEEGIDEKEENADELKLKEWLENKDSEYNKKIPDDIVLMILGDKEDGKSIEYIRSKYNISESSIYRLCEKYNVKTRSRSSSNKTKKKNQNKSSRTATTNKPAVSNVESKPSTSSTKSSSTILLKAKRDKLLCGLITDRHVLPVNVTKYVYKGPISQQVMFDYKKLEELAKQFIKNEAIEVDPETGTSAVKKDLCVFTTGLTCCVAAITKVCHDMQVNLSFMHFNNSTSGYEEQPIWTEFGINNLFKYFESYNPDKIIIFNGSQNDINVESFIISNKNVSANYTEITIFNSEKDGWKQYGNLLPEIMSDSDNNIELSFFKCKFLNGVIQSQQLSVSKNF